MEWEMAGMQDYVLASDLMLEGLRPHQVHGAPHARDQNGAGSW
jgi:hypothetical protein